MIRFTTQIQIPAAKTTVFNFVAQPANFPQWNSAVSEVVQINPRNTKPKPRYRMIRDLPTGRVVNTMYFSEFITDEVLTLEVLTGPTPFTYMYKFEEHGETTTIVLEAKVRMKSRLASLARPFLGLGIRRGVKANLQMLKHHFEQQKDTG